MTYLKSTSPKRISMEKKKISKSDLQLNVSEVTSLADSTPSGSPKDASANIACQMSKEKCVEWTFNSACFCMTQNAGEDCRETLVCQESDSAGLACCAPNDTQDPNACVITGKCNPSEYCVSNDNCETTNGCNMTDTCETNGVCPQLSVVCPETSECTSEQCAATDVNCAETDTCGIEEGDN